MVKKNIDKILCEGVVRTLVFQMVGGAIETLFKGNGSMTRILQESGVSSEMMMHVVSTKTCFLICLNKKNAINIQK